MVPPNNCDTCNQSFASDRDLQEHQENAHHENRSDKLPESEGPRQSGEEGLDGERVA
jgi:hypothetical protein